MILLESKLAEVLALHLDAGCHKSIEHGMCVMEAAGSKCACPVIATFMRAWNDGLPDADRDRLLKPLIASLVDSKSTEAVEERRSYLALDWLVRVFTPQWLDLVPDLQPHAKALRELEEIADVVGATAAGTLTAAARAAAWAAAGDAAWAAAGDAAWAAAWNAAWNAAGDAAGVSLQPTVEWLQASALDLIERMLAVQP